MALAVITEKYADGRSKTTRTSAPMSAELGKQAGELDARLQRGIHRLETSLVAEGLLDEAIPAAGSAKPRGKVQLWHRVGVELSRLANEAGVTNVRERRWLWEALDNLHATERIKRASRGRMRMHFEYCYRLAQFPLNLASKMFWSEWVYFFDSLTVREEARSDQWLRAKLEADSSLDRKLFRRFTENLNRRLRKMDTSVLGDDELFRLYDEILAGTRLALSKGAY